MAAMAGKDFKEWLQGRCGQWLDEESTQDLWTSACKQQFGKIPPVKQLSVVEMEELLVILGDEEIATMKAACEELHDGNVIRFMGKKGSGDCFACLIGAPGIFEDEVYCHKTHIHGLNVGDAVRFAVHISPSGKPQVSFLDRLTNRGDGNIRDPTVLAAGELDPRVAHKRDKDVRDSKGGKSKGKGKGGHMGGVQMMQQPVRQMAQQPQMMIMLPDGTYVQGTPVGQVAPPPQGGLPAGFGVPQPKGKGKGNYAPPTGRIPTKGAGKGPERPGPVISPENMELGRQAVAEGRMFTGTVTRINQSGGFIDCADTMELFGRDVYMWRTYFGRCQVGSTVDFKIHVSDKGLPQVCHLEVMDGGVPEKRAGDDAGGMAKAPRLA